MIEQFEKLIDGESEFSSSSPLVTVITVVFNAINGIEKTILSVIGQSYENVEYIIIDGGSTDGTLGVIKKYEEKIAYWVSEKDSGIYDAMNKGIRESHGSYIGIIGAGDWYDLDAISNVVNTFLNLDADVVYGDVSIVDAETMQEFKRHSNCELMPHSMSSISHPTTFVKRSVYSSYPFSTELRIASDYDLFLGLFINKYRFEHSGRLIVHVLTGGVSSSFNTRIEVFKVHRKYYGAWYATNKFVPTILWQLFYGVRRKLLSCLMPPATFTTLRAKWLKWKNR